jgi:hypothetical protein
VFLFWIAFFANQRGLVEQDAVQALLSQVITATTDDVNRWLNENRRVCSDVWHKIHDAMLEVFANRVFDICDGWCSSEAGKYYNTLVEKARYFQKPSTSELISHSSSKKTNPELTSEQIANGFVDSNGNTYPPMPIDDHKSVFYVFEECITACGLTYDEKVRPFDSLCRMHALITSIG